ncbi:hypothetical protein HPB51_010372 [Rhipicephalus microplus]|uniref:Uncharacterized protein n=1 Tax=Rhipicephalus microplus TaxID=6941 RepID=A0A9J6EGH3_RHIMP|nr:hypothetical protein HPB51_010372 [Rhipicephalus microplus]
MSAIGHPVLFRGGRYRGHRVAGSFVNAPTTIYRAQVGRQLDVSSQSSRLTTGNKITLDPEQLALRPSNPTPPGHVESSTPVRPDGSRHDTPYLSTIPRVPSDTSEESRLSVQGEAVCVEEEPEINRPAGDQLTQSSEVRPSYASVVCSMMCSYGGVNLYGRRGTEQPWNILIPCGRRTRGAKDGSTEAPVSKHDGRESQPVQNADGNEYQCPKLHQLNCLLLRPPQERQGRPPECSTAPLGKSWRPRERPHRHSQYRPPETRMWPGSMHGSLIWKDCGLLGSFEGTKLPNSCLQGRSISIRQDTGINNNGFRCPRWGLTERVTGNKSVGEQAPASALAAVARNAASAEAAESALLASSRRATTAASAVLLKDYGSSCRLSKDGTLVHTML